MSTLFSSLKVTQIVRETADANTVHFAKPAGDSFNYKPGQYLTLKVMIAGEEQRRAYSLCSSPLSDETLAVTVKRVEGGKVSNWVADYLQEGASMEVMPPMGKFAVEIDPNKAEHYILLGAGSGITPLMSILKTVLEGEPNSKVTLLYGNNNENTIIFHKELQAIADQHPERFRVVHCLSNPSDTWTGIKSRLDRHQVLTLVQDLLNADSLKKSFWMCGPVAMMEDAQAALGFLGIASKDVHRESFTAPLPSPEKHSTTVKKEVGTYDVTVIIDGEEQVVSVDPDTTILEAVIDDGGDPPYACQMGVCCTCRAKVLQGAVEMEEDEGLSDSEIEDGYILTCQAHPLSPDVIIEYK